MNELDLFYSERLENERLLRGTGQLEAARTVDILSRFLPAPPATIYDIGGGTGYYAAHFAAQGYDVELLDPVAQHISIARSRQHGPANAVIGDARQLPWADHSADCVLLMGPLYHLAERADRIIALKEAKRVLRPRGLLFATIIPRWASTLVGMLEGWISDDAYLKMVETELDSGSHKRPASWPRLFVDGFFHNQLDIQSEVAEAGLHFHRSLSIEGPLWMWPDFETAWSNPTTRSQILEMARRAEDDPEILASSPHVGILCGNTTE